MNAWIFPQVWKSLHPPNHTNMLGIHWRYPFPFVSLWRLNPNTKWICPPMGFSHGFFQETDKTDPKSLCPPNHTDKLGIY